MKIVCISDTHCKMNKIDLPEGDILLHAGDHSFRGSVHEMSDALKYLAKKGKDFKHIVAIDGNHDWLGQKDPLIMEQLCKDNNIIYLKDSSVTLEGFKIYGSPWQPYFCGWAFNLLRGELHEKWALIPEDTDILITHGPAAGILDECPSGEKVGCQALFERIMKVKPKLHVSGHIHHSYGVKHFDSITFVNASICNERYEPINPPIVIEL